MKRYRKLINEDFFDDVESEDIVNTEVEEEPVEEIVPKELDEVITLRFGITETNLKIVADIIKKIEPYVRYALDAWKGLKYYDKFKYRFGTSDALELREPETIVENGITFIYCQNRYRRGSNLVLNIPCKFNTNSPVNVYNVMGYLFNGVYKRAQVSDDTIQGLSFENDEKQTAKISRMIYNFSMSSDMKVRHIGEIMKVVVGIDGSLGKIYKHLKQNPALIYFNCLEKSSNRRRDTKDTIVKFAENLPMSDFMSSLPNNADMFQNLEVYDPSGGIIRTYTFYERSPYYDSIWNNSDCKDLYNDINYFLKEKNLKFDVYLRKPYGSSVVHLCVCPISTMVTDFYAVDYEEPEYDEDEEIEVDFHETEIGVVFECATTSSHIIILDEDKEPKNHTSVFKLMMKLGNMSLDEAIDFFNKNISQLPEENIEILHKWID